MRRCCLWRYLDDRIPAILIHILIISCGRRVVTWRRLQLHFAAQLQHKAYQQAQQEGYEDGQEQQLQSNVFMSTPATPAQDPQMDDSLTEHIS